MPASPLTPVTLLAGASGSGKTTLLERARRKSSLDQVTVIACAAASPLWRTAQAPDLVPGCLCCSAGDELIGALREMYYQRAAGTIPFFQRVVIEASGHTDPQRIAGMLAAPPLTSARYALDGIVTVIDAERGEGALDNMARRQVVEADCLVIAKADRVTKGEQEALQRILSELNPRARRINAHDDSFDPTSLFTQSLRPTQVLAA